MEDHESDAYIDEATRDYVKRTVGEFSEFVLIPRYDVEAAGGHGAVVGTERVKHTLAFRRDWLENEGFNPHLVAAIGLRGNSQTGFINNRDVCLVDMRYKRYVGEGVYALLIKEELVIKIVQRLPNGAMRIISRNEDDFPTYDIDPGQIDQVYFVGAVGWTGGKIPRPELPRDLQYEGEAEAAKAKLGGAAATGRRSNIDI